MTLDEIRTANPDLGVAVYAYEPGGPVTLEIHTPDGQMFSWVGATEAEALNLAFPSQEPAPPEPALDIFD
jgi:hypothetical protein